jgi:hypothetical protein
VPFTGFEGANDALEGALEDDGATFGALEESSGGYGDSMQYDQSAYGAGADGLEQQGYDGMAQQELSMEEMMAGDGDADAAGIDTGEQLPVFWRSLSTFGRDVAIVWILHQTGAAVLLDPPHIVCAFRQVRYPTRMAPRCCERWRTPAAWPAAAACSCRPRLRPGASKTWTHAVARVPALRERANCDHTCTPTWKAPFMLRGECVHLSAYR